MDNGFPSNIKTNTFEYLLKNSQNKMCGAKWTSKTAQVGLFE